MYEVLLVFPLTIFFILLVLHSYSQDGARGTALFFGYAIAFSFIRELVIGTLAPLYEGSGSLKIGNVSFAIIFGWIFTFYLSNYFVRTLVENTRFEKSLLIRTSLGTFLVVGISLIMETSAIQLDWWHWLPEVLPQITPNNSLFGAPYFVFIGWGITGFVFLCTFNMLNEREHDVKNIMTIVIMISLMLVNFVIGNFFIINPPPPLITVIHSIVVQTGILLFVFYYYKSIEKHVLLTILLFIIELWLISSIISPMLYAIGYFLLSPIYFGLLLSLLILLLAQIHIFYGTINLLKKDFEILTKKKE